MVRTLFMLCPSKSIDLKDSVTNARSGEDKSGTVEARGMLDRRLVQLLKKQLRDI